LLTAIRVDPALLHATWNTAANAGIASSWMLLPLHHDRLLAAAAAHGWDAARTALTRDRFVRECECALAAYDGPGKAGPLKVTLARDGTLTFTISPIPALPADPFALSLISHDTDALPSALAAPLELFLDTAPTPASAYTVTKTSHRPHYAAARERAGLPPLTALTATSTTSPITAADVILWNDAGLLTETSIRNLALFRRGRWLTPTDASGCLPGVARRWLLASGRVHLDTERVLRVDQLEDGEMAIVFNAVEGCRLGVV
ncbi:hypothetical protein HETIRDRAFT_241567, partial [Heterobasidion irregulare TC 32-1]